MSDLLRVTTPLIPKDYTSKVRTDAQPSIQDKLNISDPTRVVSTNPKELAQEGAKQQSILGEHLLSTSAMSKETATISKSVKRFLNSLLISRDGSNGSGGALSEENVELINKFLLNPDQLIESLASQKSSLTAFEGPLFDFLRQVNNDFPDNATVQKDIIAFLKAYDAFVNANSSNNSVVNILSSLMQKLLSYDVQELTPHLEKLIALMQQNNMLFQQLTQSTNPSQDLASQLFDQADPQANQANQTNQPNQNNPLANQTNQTNQTNQNNPLANQANQTNQANQNNPLANQANQTNQANQNNPLANQSNQTNQPNQNNPLANQANQTNQTNQNNPLANQANQTNQANQNNPLANQANQTNQANPTALSSANSSENLLIALKELTAQLDKSVLKDSNGKVVATLQDDRLIDNKGNVVARLQNGVVTDHNSNPLSKMLNGLLVSKASDFLSKITNGTVTSNNAPPDNGIILNSRGEIIAKLTNNILSDLKGNQIGKLDQQGVFLDQSGKPLFDLLNGFIVNSKKNVLTNFMNGKTFDLNGAPHTNSEDGVLIDSDGEILGSLKDNVLLDKNANFVGVLSGRALFDSKSNLLSRLIEGAFFNLKDSQLAKLENGFLATPDGKTHAKNLNSQNQPIVDEQPNNQNTAQAQQNAPQTQAQDKPVNLPLSSMGNIVIQKENAENQNPANLAQTNQNQPADTPNDTRAILHKQLAISKETLHILKNDVIPTLADIVPRQIHKAEQLRDQVMLLIHNTVRLERSDINNLISAMENLISNFNDSTGEIKAKVTDMMLDAIKISPKERRADAIQNVLNMLEKTLDSEPSASVSKNIALNALQNLLSSRSVDVPLLHMLLPVSLNGINTIGELWVDPNAQNSHGKDQNSDSGDNVRFVRLFLSFELDSMGDFEVDILTNGETISLNMSCPPSTTEIFEPLKDVFKQIAANNDLKMNELSIQPLRKKRTVIEVFKKMYINNRGVVNVKV